MRALEMLEGGGSRREADEIAARWLALGAPDLLGVRMVPPSYSAHPGHQVAVYLRAPHDPDVALPYNCREVELPEAARQMLLRPTTPESGEPPG